MKAKIAMVCQRYGLEVNGGAELLCRQYAEKLKDIYDVEIYTTCAMDYVTWANHYAPGVEVINGVTVRRFRSDQERNQEQFDEIHTKLLTKRRHSDKDEQIWLERQGPVCSELVKAIADHHKEYKAVLFMTYLYYTTAMGILPRFDNAILIPTAHDEPPVYFRHYDKVFDAARAFIWLTPEEKTFAEKRFPSIKGRPGVITGAGVDVPTGELPEIPEELKGQDYLVYAGRIDESKGCEEMFRFFLRYKWQYYSDLKLVLMGRAVLDVPKHPDIISLGFVSDEMKFAVMKQAKALLLFSRYESLSMVALESMKMARPVLLSGYCDVLKGHCLRSNAGLYFKDYYQFAGCVNYLLEHPDVYDAMCSNGVKYVDEHYQWDSIINRIVNLIDQM